MAERQVQILYRVMVVALLRLAEEVAVAEAAERWKLLGV